MSDNIHVIESEADLVFDGDALTAIKRTQEIPQEFLDGCKEERNASTGRKMGEFHKFASIPAALYEEWLRQGFDPTREPASKVIAKLKAEGLDLFLTTDRRL